ncbi:hypothetical protein H9P43_000365 [Blastocladiella emersonii ATCC 22665]|nr:hypothetical protein H9P43_000365 [Blastocladiella emersonii ATCC 22665]
MTRSFSVLALVVLALAQLTAAAVNVENKYIVTLKSTSDQTAFTRKLHVAIATENSKESVSVEHKLERNYNIEGIFKGYAGQFSADFAARLKKDPNVASVEPDAEVKALGSQAGAPWGLVRISQREKNLSAPYTYPDSAGAGVTAYVIDTGILISHPEFEGRASWGATFCDGCPDTDDQGHGTHCAGTIGSKSYGVAKSASLKAVKVLNKDGSGSYAGVISGIEWVANQVKQSGNTQVVASMSLGGPKNDAVNKAVQAAITAGVTFTIAAGNESQDACKVSPASVPEAITVGATENTDALASYSNFGTCVDVLAPGTGILSTWNNGKTNTISGTSMATPHVAGLVALVLSENPGLTPAQVAAKISAAATTDKITGVKGSPNKLIFNGVAPPSSSTTTATSTSTKTATTTTTVAPTPTKTATTTTTTRPTRTPTPTPTPTQDPEDPECPWWWPWC